MNPFTVLGAFLLMLLLPEIYSKHQDEPEAKFVKDYEAFMEAFCGKELLETAGLINKG